MEPKQVVVEEEDIFIVGAGIAGLTTSLGLHRLGIRSVILETADTLRVEGYALSLWTNSWKALDAVAVGNDLRARQTEITTLVNTTLNTGLPIAEFTIKGERELRRVKRKTLVETLMNELPEGTIRYSSKVAHIQDDPDSFYELIRLADGTILKTKLLIGCDGVNSVVAKYLGFNKPSLAGRVSIRGYVEYEDKHGFEPVFVQSLGNGIRYGITASNEYGVNWYLTYNPSPRDEEGMLEDGAKMKQFVLSKLGNASNEVKAMFEKTNPNTMLCVQLKYRHPWELFRGNISTQQRQRLRGGGRISSDDSRHRAGRVFVTRRWSCISKSHCPAFTGTGYGENCQELLQQRRIKAALKTYAEERRWRSIKLVITSYMVGYNTAEGCDCFQLLKRQRAAHTLAWHVALDV